MIRPPALKPGDSIGIVSTARKVTPGEISTAVDIFKSWGLEILTGRFLFSEDNQFSGTDEERIYDLQTMIDNPEVKAIICARGGYGTTRIIDRVDFSNLKENPKWIAGFSDVTAILCHLNRMDIECIHSIMPILFDVDGVEDSIESLRLTLFGKPEEIQAESHPLNRFGSCSSEVIGGNLTILTNLFGTSSHVNTTGKILFIEDIDEYLYHIDRLIVQLKRSGVLKELSGLIVGQMTAMNDNEIPFGKDSYEIIADHVAEYDYPVSFQFPVGHEAGNFAIPCGRTGEFTVNESGSLLRFK